MKIKNFFFLFTITTLISCGPNFIYENEQIISDNNWEYQDSLNFQFEIADTNKLFNIFLDVEHSVDYGFQNLYTQIHTVFPSNDRITEMLSLELADKAGQWFGDCSSEFCTLRIPIQEGAFFNQAGNYSITVEQFMRKNPLEGVKSIAIRIEDTSQTRS